MKALNFKGSYCYFVKTNGTNSDVKIKWKISHGLSHRVVWADPWHVGWVGRAPQGTSQPGCGSYEECHPPFSVSLALTSPCGPDRIGCPCMLHLYPLALNREHNNIFIYYFDFIVVGKNRKDWLNYKVTLMKRPICFSSSVQCHAHLKVWTAKLNFIKIVEL